MFDNVTKILTSCTCGKKHSLLTDECVVDNNCEAAMKQYIAGRGFSAPVIVCDENTEKFTVNMTAQFDAKVVTVSGHAHATEVYTAQVNDFIDQVKPDVLIACGSGSVHDITRYCAFEKKIPFISYPTAASVDGFVSGVAAMTWYGQKLTFESAPPIAVFASPAVFCTAPDRLTASGVGDVFGKYTSLFDWKIGKILTGEYYCEEIAGLEVDAMNDLTEVMLHRDAYTAEDYTTKVMNALLLSGLAMQLAGNSRPASGAEHHMSHLWEMARINEDTDALHGEKVAVGLMAVLRTYKKYLANVDIDAIRAIDVAKVMDRAYLAPVYGELTDGILKENMPDGTPASSSLSKIKIDDADATLAAIREAAEDLPETDALEKLLKIAGATLTTSEVGLPAEDGFVETTLTYAPYVRNRLSLLKVIKAAELCAE